MTATEKWRVTAYDHEGRVRFITAEWDRRTAEDIAAALIPEDDVASVHVEALDRPPAGSVSADTSSTGGPAGRGGAGASPRGPLQCPTCGALNRRWTKTVETSPLRLVACEDPWHTEPGGMVH